MQPGTSWLVYSHKPTKEEQKIIDQGVATITQKNPDALGDNPFVSPEDLDGVDKQTFEDSRPVTNVTARLVHSGAMAGNLIRSKEIDNRAKQAFTPIAVKKELQEPVSEPKEDVPNSLSIKNRTDESHKATLVVELSDGSTPPEPILLVTQSPCAPPPNLSGHLRLRIKHPAPQSSPIKSPSSSPQKKSSTKGTKASKHTNKGQGEEKLPLGGGNQGTEPKSKHKAKAVGKKRK
ncbi:uncharacterized protein MELLADRAFT_95931 [Melampsora larici-populina 98AG31]|uniref:Uncharacterized protein n=1 Tax=Melampsora larici-populina (strain 98AG31 / pathotype 3-4-7) TaxID=747676 RepID=F4RDS9_MELLP|nr:uncharacterized protein MELLADRAFT_95931 [Melampsora larici-populina 98AG31]EGG09454.1 hypothetical protein MELLADRAFT_95931 [Melampsora larici-populina 98AG31]